MPVVASEAALTPHDVCLWHKADMLNALTKPLPTNLDL
jgi:hypothetical protein